MQKLCFEKLLWSTSEMVNARIFNPYVLCSATMKTYFSWDFWSSRNKRKVLSKQKCVLRKCCGIPWKCVNARALNFLPLC